MGAKQTKQWRWRRKKKTTNVRWLAFTNATVISASRLRSVFASHSFSLPRRVQNSLAAGEKDEKKIF